MSQAAPHIPVLLAEVIDALAISPGETHVDGTFGAGGYSRAMTKAGARVIAFDRDPDAIAAGRAAGDEGLTLVQDRFSNMAHHLPDPVMASRWILACPPCSLIKLGVAFLFRQMARLICAWSRWAKAPLTS